MKLQTEMNNRCGGRRCYPGQAVTLPPVRVTTAYTGSDGFMLSDATICSYSNWEEAALRVSYDIFIQAVKGRRIRSCAS